MLKEKNSPISRSFNTVLFWLIKIAIGTTNLFLAPKTLSETDKIKGRSGFLRFSPRCSLFLMGFPETLEKETTIVVG